MKTPYFDIGVPFVAGGIVFMLIAYGTGLMTASNTARADVVAARIDERAIMCQEAAIAYLAQKAGGTGAADQAKALAEQFYVATGDVNNDRAGREECSRKLSV
jgi:hypothetical protein